MGERVQLRARVAEKNHRHHLLRRVDETSGRSSPPRLLLSLLAMVRLEQSVRIPHILSVHLALDELDQESVPVLGSGLELLEKSERRCMYWHAGHRVRGGGHAPVRAVS